MAIRYDGKSPGNLWYFWQKTKALMKTPFDYTTRKDAGRFGKDVGIGVGALAGANLLLGVPILAATPILPWVIGFAGIMTGFHFGRNAWNKFKGLKETALVTNYVHQQEEKWYDRQKRGPLLKRIKEGFKAKMKLPLPLVKAAKWLGLGGATAGVAGATAGALSYAGVPAFATSATATTILSGIAQAGALVGLTAATATAVAVGAAVLAIPAGIGVFVAARNAVIRRNPDKPSFGVPKKQEPSGEPIEKGQVFTAEKGNSFDFNETAEKPAAKKEAPPPANDDDGMSEARRKAAEERARNRKNRGGGPRFD